jgi:hypothetical protein
VSNTGGDQDNVISVIVRGLHGFLDFLKRLDVVFVKGVRESSKGIKDCRVRVSLLLREPGEADGTTLECTNFIKLKMAKICALNSWRIILESLRESIDHYIHVDDGISMLESLEPRIEKTNMLATGYWSYSFFPSQSEKEMKLFEKNSHETLVLAKKRKVATKIKKSRNTKIEKSQNTKIKKSRNTKIEKSQNTKIKKSRNTKIKKSQNTRKK